MCMYVLTHSHTHSAPPQRSQVLAQLPLSGIRHRKPVRGRWRWLKWVGPSLLPANQTQYGSLGVWLKEAGRAVSSEDLRGERGFPSEIRCGGRGGEEGPGPLLDPGFVGVTRGCTDSK